MKVYIASPFFNSKQVDQVEFLKEALVAAGHEYFSPKDFFVLKPNATQEDRTRIFDVKSRLSSSLKVCPMANLMWCLVKQVSL